jgi:hypothetical protein
MSDGCAEHADIEEPEPCWQLQAGFCASRANGRPRCRKGSCWLAENENPRIRPKGWRLRDSKPGWHSPL